MEDYMQGFMALQEEYEAKLAAHAEAYRVNVLIPLCRKYKLRFIQGMGTFFFAPSVGQLPPHPHSTTDWTFSYSYEIESHPRGVSGAKEMKEALDFLNTEFGNGPNDIIGFLVDDVNENCY